MPRWNVDTPLSASFEDMMQLEHKECLCLETYGRNVLGFHDVPNTLLMDLVQCVQAEWMPGVAAMSNAVSSVISDYATGLDNIRIEDEIDDRYVDALKDQSIPREYKKMGKLRS